MRLMIIGQIRSRGSISVYWIHDFHTHNKTTVGQIIYNLEMEEKK